MMQKGLQTVLVLCTLLFPAVFPRLAVLAQSRLPGWHSDLKTAAAVARRTGKPLFVVFRCVR